MLMGTHNRAVDHRVFVIGIASQLLEYLFQDAAFSPSAPASVRILPIAKPFWQITPRHSGSIPIKNSIYKQAVIGRRAANMPFPPRKKIFDPLPLIVSQRITSYHAAPPFKPIFHESHFTCFANLLTDDTP